VYRLDAKTGARQQPIQDANGNFVLGDPKLGDQKHTVANQVYVKTEQEMVDLIRHGFSVRVQTATRTSLVRRNIFIDGARVS